ncbi:UDP-N-acetylglucosamine 2-epimerase [Oligoflexus tunisiensis]|uniref:UDP-N-acetylglucosamine 2-epimerase n=1 Tax=Oligoflexus tunisiensis TaxID=708132 RepID=UPI000AF1A5E5|nr:UDP-N-acetylglucosamine 2-epimerase [Oligoflexus tunisiensis]
MGKKSKKICVVTGSRAEYGLLFWLLKELKADTAFELQIIATGMHLSPEFGLTYRAIEADGFGIHEKIEMLLSGDSNTSVAKSAGLGMIGFVDSFNRLQPDLIVVLGDRFEIFASCSAAMLLKIPVAHVHGGEITEGAIDESIRHAITKMSHFHFTSSEVYRKRVIQMGEDPERVFNVGAPGVENLVRFDFLSKEAFLAELGLPQAPSLLVTFHPETLSTLSVEDQLAELFAALDELEEYSLIITKSNADECGRRINAMLDKFCEQRSHRTYLSASLGHRRYLNAIKVVDAVVGNSSSGIIEAPFAGTPTINIGDRQKGRLRTPSIYDVPYQREAIVAMVKKAVRQNWRSTDLNERAPYGLGDFSKKTLSILRNIEFQRSMPKPFFDVAFENLPAKDM